MTIAEAIAKVDEIKPNQYDAREKIGWLSTLDGLIKNEVIDSHMGSDEVSFACYTKDTPLTTVLLVPEPYSSLYIDYLTMKIDYSNNEIDRYNNSMNMFNNSYYAFQSFYNRTHMPKNKGKFKY